MAGLNQPVIRPSGAFARAAGVWREIVKGRSAYLFLLPKLIFFVLFVAVPVGWAVLLAFQKYKIIGGAQWAGLANFTALARSDLFRIALWNTIKYTLVTVPASLLLALGLATLIHPLVPRARSFFRSAFYLPTVTSAVVIAMVWRWIYQPRGGLANGLLGLLGIGAIDWLGSAQWALWSLIIMAILTPPGLGVILYLAAMDTIPGELYEAAAIDGAGPFYRWRVITVPMLKPTTFYLAVIGTITSFQVFTQVLIMTGGGPGHSTRTLVTLIYDTAFRDLNFGLASAQSMVLFVIILVISIAQYRFLSSHTES